MVSDEAGPLASDVVAPVVGLAVPVVSAVAEPVLQVVPEVVAPDEVPALVEVVYGGAALSTLPPAPLTALAVTSLALTRNAFAGPASLGPAGLDLVAPPSRFGTARAVAPGSDAPAPVPGQKALPNLLPAAPADSGGAAGAFAGPGIPAAVLGELLAGLLLGAALCCAGRARRMTWWFPEVVVGPG